MNDKARMWLKLLSLVIGTFLASLSVTLQAGKPLNMGETLAALGAALITLNAFIDKTVARVDDAAIPIIKDIKDMIG